jgi:dTDP-glucose pyrophosphorylase
VTDNISQFFINKDKSIYEALKQLDESAEKILFVVDNNEKLIGSLTDGDIRRWILAEGKLEESVKKACNKSPFIVNKDFDIHKIKKIMVKEKLDCIPVVDNHQRIFELLFWEDVFGNIKVKKEKGKLEIPVVIMAGGKGTRLDPFTKILPKPLIPIGDKTILEIIINNFIEYQVMHFSIIVNHKSRIIKSYFEELSPNCILDFVYEKIPLGTAGGLQLLQNKINGDFILTNCDIIINVDYSKLIKFHADNKNDITIVASLKNFSIPYGICEIENGGELSEIKEKPEYKFLVNTGFYIIKSKVIDLIPKNKFYHITDLIINVKKCNGKIGVYPISEDSWIDTGEWREYKKTLERFRNDK